MWHYRFCSRFTTPFLSDLWAIFAIREYLQIYFFEAFLYGSNLVIWDNDGAMRVESVRLGGVKLDELSLGIKQTVRNELSVKLGLKVVFS